MSPAWDDWAKRTPDSLNRAVGEFNGAIARDPHYSEAYAGLADCYNLLREYTRMPDAQAFPLARAAAMRAVALDDRLAAAHAALAFADFNGFWDEAGARREFQRAVELDPRSATTRHWYATFLMETGDGPGSIRQIETARALDPGSISIAVDRADVLYIAGRTAEAVSLLKAAESVHPDFAPIHVDLADYAFDQGRDADFLIELRRLATLRADRSLMAAASAADQGFQAAGHDGLMRALLAEEIAQFTSGVAPAYQVARTYALLGDTARAMDYLQIGIERREFAVTQMRVDPAFARLRGDRRFGALAARIRPA
ncbi:MAG: hypothetical protein ABI376_04785 [Caulobacteraceae bacterium]